MGAFHLVSELSAAGGSAAGDRRSSSPGWRRGSEHQVLLGVTGSGKTFTMANVIAAVDRPALVIAHNKTLAAQLYGEFKTLFPENAVEYFVSYYDYYQPEAYIPSTDTYIEKDSAINEEIDKLRHAATHSLLERRDVIIVASVSCIYGIGSPEAYHGMLLMIEEGAELPRDAMLARLVEIQYERNDIDFHRGTFRVRGDVVEIFPPYEEERAIRVEFFGDTVEAISVVDPLRGKKLERLRRTAIYPGSHYVTTKDNLKRAIGDIRTELGERLRELQRRKQAPGGAAPGAADPFRHRDDGGDGVLLGDRELLPPPDRPQARRAAADPDGVFSRGRPRLHRREPCDDPPADRDVPGRPVPEGDPRQLRLPPPLGARQPAAALRGVRGVREPADLRLGDAGGL